jgi:hypothetical protein
MRYTTTRRGDLELVITDVADWSEFERIDGPDGRYWDLDLGGQTVTLHLQHYPGITLDASSAEGESLVRRIGQFQETKTR